MYLQLHTCGCTALHLIHPRLCASERSPVLVSRVDRATKREATSRKQQQRVEKAKWAAEAAELHRAGEEATRRLDQSAAQAAGLEAQLAEAAEQLASARAEAAAEVAASRARAEDSQGALLRASSSAANRFLGRLFQSSEHRLLSHSLGLWRAASHALAGELEALVAGKRSRACAIILTASAAGGDVLRVRRLGSALRVWLAAAADIARECMARAAQESAETTRMVRTCYATDKLGIALSVSGAASLRSAWWVWYAATCALDGDHARDEAEILRTELSTELRQNAELQQRVTTLEIGAIETAKLVPSEAAEQARHKADQDVREAKRRAAVARGEADELSKELATTQQKLDQMQVQHEVLQGQHARGARTHGDEAARIKALSTEVEVLRRFSELASGAHRFARWRIWLAAMKRKRAEQRAASAVAARRPAVAPPELLERLRQRLGGARRQAMLVLTGAPREACCRALWRWRCAVVSKAGEATTAAAVAATAAAAAAGPATAAAARSEAAAAAARDEVLWARESTKRASEAEGMLHEAIAAGDAQTRRVLQLQKAVGATRRTLAACLLRSSLSASGRTRCAHMLHRWALVLSAKTAQRALADAKSARDGASRARETAKASEGFAKDSQEAAAKEVEGFKKRLMAAEKSRGSLRDQVSGLGSELEAERRLHASTREEYEHRLGVTERAKAQHEVRSQQLEVVQGERLELEGQLRMLRQKLKQSALLLPPGSPAAGMMASPAAGMMASHSGGNDADDDVSTAAPGSPSLFSPAGASGAPSGGPGRSAGRGRAGGGDATSAALAAHSSVSKATADLEDKLRAQTKEKEQALSLRTRAVRDLRATREELDKCRAELTEAQKSHALARLLAHARSRVGRPAQLLRLLAALRDWREACGVVGESAWVVTGEAGGAGAPQNTAARGGRPQAMWTTPATAAGGKRGGEAAAAPTPHGWAVSLRASRLGELRVRLLNRVLVWSLKGRYRALLRWRTFVYQGLPTSIGWAAGGGDDMRLHELLREVADMKSQVASSRTPGREESSTSRTPGRASLTARGR